MTDPNKTPKQFYDWQTAGGTDDVMRLVDCLERADLAWCAIGGVAVNHWSAETMVTQTEDFYKDFPSRSVPADIHGILMRVASLEDTLRGKIKAWRDTEKRQSERLKDLGDIARLIESHSHLWELLDPGLKEIIQKQ